MGGPSTPDQVRPFLEELFSDPEMIRLPRLLRRFQPALARRIAKRRSVSVGEKYRAIGGSPIVETTTRLAAAVQDELAAAGIGAVAVAGMRYGSPRAPDAIEADLASLAERHPGAPVVLLPQYPFYSTATTASSLHEAEASVRALGLRPIPVLRFGSHPDHIALMDALTRETLDLVPEDHQRELHLLVSVHGLPEHYIRAGDPYRSEVEACVLTLQDTLSDRLPADRIHLSFQSRVGPVKWTRPATDETIVRLAEDGVKHLVVLPLGFTCDHLETLEEIDLLYGGLAKERGMETFRRVPTPGLDPRYVRLQARLVKEHLGPNGGG